MKKLNFLKYGLTALMMAFAMTLCFSCSSDDDEDNPIMEDMTLPSNATSKINGHDYVDLGLPSGAKWATCNVGADSPEKNGDYYSWGETETKELYEWYNYKWSYLYRVYKYNSESWRGEVDNKEVLDPEDDVAHVKWGGSWHIPTKAEADELKENCTMENTTLNGKKCLKVTGKNGNSIFLPAAGCHEGEMLLMYEGRAGQYWMNSVTDWDGAKIFDFTFLFSDGWMSTSGGKGRCYGLSVRPVAN